MSDAEYNWSFNGSSRVPSAGEDRWLLEGSWGVAGSDRLPTAGEATKGSNKQVRLYVTVTWTVFILFTWADQRGFNSFITTLLLEVGGHRTAGGHARVVTKR